MNHDLLTPVYLFEGSGDANLLQVVRQIPDIVTIAPGNFPELESGIILVDCDSFDVLSNVVCQYTLPVIALIGDEEGEKALNYGAWDFLYREHLTPYLLQRCLKSARKINELMTRMQILEHAFANSEMRFNNLVKKNSDGIVVVDDEGIIRFVNPAGEVLFGRVADRLLGTTLGFPVTSGDSTEMEIIRRSGEIGVAELRVVDTDWANDHAYLLSLRDVTDRKAGEIALREGEKLRLEIEKEKEISELKSKFMTTILHEFRTPLTIIQSSSDLLDHYFDRLDETKRRSKLDTIREQIGHLEGMLTEISMIVHADQGKLVYQPRELNLKAFCEKVVEDIRGTIGTMHRITFEVEGDDDWNLLGDPKLLIHIFNNLLSNAIKYSANETDILFQMSRVSDMIMLRIVDHGIGIPEADQAQLFEAFHRASNVGNIAGTGLGLRVVKECVTLHGGTFRVDSTEGVGTTCTVYLPRLRAEAMT